jgi:hypothetical protein
LAVKGALADQLACWSFVSLAKFLQLTIVVVRVFGDARVIFHSLNRRFP